MNKEQDRPILNTAILIKKIAQPARKPMKEADMAEIYVNVLGMNAHDDTECKIVLKIARLVEKYHEIL